MASANLRRGYFLAITTYLMWGLYPLFFKQLEAVPALEIVVHRVLWSALLGVTLLAVWKHPGWWQELRQHPKRLLALTCSGALIACNWLTYVWAVNNQHMVEASLGYYISPLVNVLLALIVLGERLRRLQWLAMALACTGVLQQLWQLGSLPWVSLVLALTFGVYGLIRRQAPVAALPGLVVETLMVLPLALGWLYLHPAAVSSQAEFWSTSSALWLLAAGPATLIPLIFFNQAARYLPYSSLGFLQYTAPTIVLLLAVFLYDEPLDGPRLTAFAFIWAALAIFSFDMLRTLKQRTPQ